VRNADKLVAVRLVTDSPNAAFVQLEAHLISVSPFEFVPKSLDFGHVSARRGDAQRAQLLRTATLPDGTLLDSRPLSEQFLPSGEAFADEPLIAHLYPDPELSLSAWQVVLEIPAGVPQGNYAGKLRIPTRRGGESGAPAGPVLELPYSARVQGDMLVEPNQIVLRPDDRGRVEPRFVTVSALDRSAFRIERTEFLGEGRNLLKLATEPLSPDEEGRSRRWRIELAAPEGLGDVGFGGTLRLHLDGAAEEVLDVPYVGILML
jgi:hypothetical protein